MKTARSTIWPLVLLWYTLFLPPQVALDVGGNLIYGYRFAIIIGLPIAIQQFINSGKKLTLIDCLSLVSGATVILSLTLSSGFLKGIIKGFPIAVDFAGTYYIARGSINSIADIRRVLAWLAPAFLVAGIIVTIESFSHSLIVKPVADALFGARSYLGSAVEVYAPRLGLSRGMGPFAHPILAGLCLSLALPLYWGNGAQSMTRLSRAMGLIGGTLAVFSLSSTAFVSLALSSALLFYDGLSRRTLAVRWDIFLTLVLAAGTAIQFGYNGGLLKFGIRFALSSGSAWYRYAEWQYGLLSVWQHPLFGIGITEYTRPQWMVSASIDSIWLLLSINYGLISSGAFLILQVSAIIKLSLASRNAASNDIPLIRSIAFTIANLIIAGFFVSYFGGAENWLPLMAGVALSVANSIPPNTRPSSRNEALGAGNRRQNSIEG